MEGLEDDEANNSSSLTNIALMANRQGYDVVVDVDAEVQHPHFCYRQVSLKKHDREISATQT